MKKENLRQKKDDAPKPIEDFSISLILFVELNYSRRRENSEHW
jgi:hypothetical protein